MSLFEASSVSGLCSSCMSSYLNKGKTQDKSQPKWTSCCFTAPATHREAQGDPICCLLWHTPTSLYLHIILQLQLHAVILLLILHPQLIQMFLKLFHLSHASMQEFQLWAKEEHHPSAVTASSCDHSSALQTKARAQMSKSPAEQAEKPPSALTHC